ncbi:calcium-binding protein, partial [Mesorhizobium sp. B1-1-5]|uniref:calcium-binding protein n=1 Tax=Mesorhizobium sp. B1-1-5 TaxID=2589979 RepID=UPI00116B09E2
VGASAQAAKNAVRAATTPISPLVLDLNGDGIQLSSLSDSTAFFDLTSDSFARHTGWVTGGDGLLAIDRNGNGKIDNITELFGNSTTDGFSVLSALDSNGDGVIDANDASFSELRVWIDSNGDGITDPAELVTLAQEGITSIDLHATSSNQVISGNSISSESRFAWANGTTGSIVDAWFQNDATDTRYVGDYQFSPDTMLLPCIRGYGEVPDLWIAMNQNGTLLDMVSHLAENINQDPATTLSNVKSLLLEWSGSSEIDRTSRGDQFDAQELDFLEKYTGEAFYDANYNNVAGLPPTNPRWLSAVLLREGWNSAYDGVMARLILQAGYNLPEFTYDFQTDKILPQTDLATSFVDEFQKLGEVTASNEAQWEIVLRVADAARLDLNLSPEAFVSTIATSASASLAAIASALLSGEDFTVNADGSIALSGVTIDSVLHAGGNVRSISLTGNNSLLPPSLNDTIVYRRGDGNLDIDIVDYSETATNTLEFGHGIDPSDLVVAFDANRDLTLKTGAAGDEITLIKMGQSGTYGVQDISFADGTTWDRAQIVALAESGTAGNDYVYGTSGNDQLSGDAGDDYLEGDSGNDTYSFNPGDGHDTIYDNGGTSDVDKLVFGAGINPADVTVTQTNSGHDLLLSIAGTGDTVTLRYQVDYAYGGVDQVVFADGTVW